MTAPTTGPRPEGPLQGIRVVDLSAMAAGPLATAVLADQGADVIKLERPGDGDLIRHVGTLRNGVSALFATLNRNKRSVAVDLTSAPGQALVHRLVATADVFVHNLRAGVAARLGVDEEALRRHQPDVVYVSITGWGTEGPDVGRPAYDSVMQAASGIAAHQADPATGVPQFVRNVICDKSTGLGAAQLITAALFARERGAGGQHVHLSMLHAALAFLWPDGMQEHTFLDDGGDRSEGKATQAPVRPTADGYISVSTMQDAEFRSLCAVLGRADLADDERFATAGERSRNSAALHDLLNPIIATWPTDRLTAALAAAGVPHAVVAPLDRLHVAPQVVANQLLTEIAHPVAGRMRVPRPLGDLDATPLGIRRPAPALGEHTDEVLAELGVGDAEVAGLRAAGVIA